MRTWHKKLQSCVDPLLELLYFLLGGGTNNHHWEEHIFIFRSEFHEDQVTQPPIHKIVELVAVPIRE